MNKLQQNDIKTLVYKYFNCFVFTKTITIIQYYDKYLYNYILIAEFDKLNLNLRIIFTIRYIYI